MVSRRHCPRETHVSVYVPSGELSPSTWKLTLRRNAGAPLHALERLIDSFTEGLIEKDQFTARMARTKNRIVELDARIKADAGDADHLEHLRLAAKRLRELAAAVGPHLATADWHRRRDIIRTLVQRIEIGREVIKIVFRVTPDARGSGPESVVVTLSRE